MKTKCWKKTVMLALLIAIVLTAVGCGKAQALVEQGVKQLEDQEYETAAQTFEEARTSRRWYDSAKEEDILLYRAEALMGAQEFESALKVYEGLVEKDPDNSRFLQDQGLALFALSRYEEASDAFLQAAKDDPSAYEYAGRAMEALARYEEAEDYYSQALSKDPENGDLYLSLVNCRMQREDYTGAMELIDEGVKRADASALQGLLYRQAVCYEYLGEFETARDKMKAYVEQYPDDEAAKKEYEFLKSR